jgi:hypothetical protein
MNLIDRRVSYLLGCIGSRGVIIYIVKITTTSDLYYIGIFHLFVASKFIFKDFLESPDYNPFFLKPIHAIIYLVFAFCAMRGYNDYAWKILIVDLLFGVVIHTFYNPFTSLCLSISISISDKENISSEPELNNNIIPT